MNSATPSKVTPFMVAPFLLYKIPVWFGSSSKQDYSLQTQDNLIRVPLHNPLHGNYKYKPSHLPNYTASHSRVQFVLIFTDTVVITLNPT
jgi:hypothetical protein